MYVCNRTFVSINGKQYTSQVVIDEEEYNNLTQGEKNNFEEQLSAGARGYY